MGSLKFLGDGDRGSFPTIAKNLSLEANTSFCIRKIGQKDHFAIPSNLTKVPFWTS